MKLLNVSCARSIWLFPVEDLNPDGLDLVPIVVAIRTRFRFSKSPGRPDEVSLGEGIRFGAGTFALEDGRQVEVPALTIYQDGLVAETRHSTEATDQFLTSLLDLVSKNHGLKFEGNMVQSKRYTSELIVSSDIELDRLSETFSRFAAFLSTLEGASVDYRASAVSFSTDPQNPNSAQHFRFERRVGSRVAENRYFSQAALRTDDHMTAIEEWERLVSA